MQVRSREPGVSLSGDVLLDPQALQGPLHLRQASYRISDFFRKEKACQCGGAVAASQAPLSS